ncbi:uncharacterized protein LOC144703148 [Wolffia australiana]
MTDDGGSNRSSSSGVNQPSGEDPQPCKSGQASVTSVYRAVIGGAAAAVTVGWACTLVNHTLSVAVDQPGFSAACKIDLKLWRPFWSKRGLKPLELGPGRRVDVFWDLRSAHFAGRPEPNSGFYIALVSNDAVALLLGDAKKEAFKRTKARPAAPEAALVSRRESVAGKRSFSARARLRGDDPREREIVVESCFAGGLAEMRISVDGQAVLRVDNLRWKFRGNVTVVVEDMPVEVLWDVHGWLFGVALGVGQAVFLFRAGGASAAEGEAALSAVPEFSFVLYACRVE